MSKALSPGIMLATSMHAQPGVYAVLLGSGASSGAGVLTGWGIVRDLVARIAAQVEPGSTDGASAWSTDPELWWQQRFDEPLGYSSLLSKLAPTPAARQGLLAPFFEPTGVSRVGDEQQPSAAHRALAVLVKRGFVRVIITTNFDRLIEQALSAVGVEPQVISRPEAVAGMRPLAHASATVIKLHGDYRDTDSLNTAEELSTYPAQWTNLLRQVFEEYGLLICGWSGDWDTALVRTIEDTTSRRYPLYWDSRSSTGQAATRLLTARGGEVVDAPDADHLFRDLGENLQALDRLAEPPLTTKLTLARLKRYLPDPVRRIDLYDLVTGCLDPVSAAVAKVGPSLPPQPELFESAVTALAEATGPLLEVLTTAVFHDDGSHDDLWVRTMQHLLDLRATPSGQYWDATVSVQHLPAQLALFAMAAVAIGEHKDALLLRLASEPSWRSPFSGSTPQSAATQLHENRVLDSDLVKAMPMWGQGGGRWHYPQSHLLRQLLEPVVTGYARPGEYRARLDDVEYRLALVQWRDQSAEVWIRAPQAGEYVGERAWMGGGTPPQAEERLLADLGRAEVAEAWAPLLGADSVASLLEFRAEIAQYRRFL